MQSALSESTVCLAVSVACFVCLSVRLVSNCQVVDDSYICDSELQLSAAADLEKGLILGVTFPHGRTSCNHIFIEDTCLQKKRVAKFYFGGSYILQSVFHAEP